MNFVILLSKVYLEESVREWWYLQTNITDFPNLSLKFKARYWNNTIQRTVKRKIDFGRYKYNIKITRVEYATQLLETASD